MSKVHLGELHAVDQSFTLNLPLADAQIAERLPDVRTSLYKQVK